MKPRKIVHYPCGAINPYNRLLADSLDSVGVQVELRDAKHHTNPARSLSWAWGAPLVHFHWLQGLYIGRSWWRFTARSLIFLVVLTGLRLSGTRMVLTVHNLVPHEHRYRKLHRFVNVVVGKLMHRLVVHSQPAQDAVGSEYSALKKIVVIEHIDYGDPIIAITQGQARHKLGLSPKRKILLFFGNIRLYKGVDHLIDAAKNLDGLGYDLVIAGRPHTEALARGIEQAAIGQTNVRLRLGELSDERLSEYLIACDVVAFPYQAGLSSGAAHLALSHARPILCSSSIAFEHLVTNGIALSWEPSHHSDLCKVAAEALSLDLETWANNVAAYRARCHRASVGPRLKQVYAELLNGRLER